MSKRERERNMKMYREGIALLRRTEVKRIKFMLLNILLPSIRSRLMN